MYFEHNRASAGIISASVGICKPPAVGCIPKWGGTSPCLRSLRSTNHLAINSESEETAVLSPHSSPLSPRSFGRSGLVGPPLCGGSAPATPPLLPTRPGVDIGDRCLIEGVQPDPAPPFPSNPPGDRSCACPGPPNQRTARKGRAWRLPSGFARAGKLLQTPLAYIPGLFPPHFWDSPCCLRCGP